MASQEAKFSLLVKEMPFEVREYERHVLAQTQVNGDFSEAGKQAFGRLFRYISGHNLSQQKITMTAPVTQQQEGQQQHSPSQASGGWWVSFIMPAEFQLADTPQPKNASVHLQEVPTQQMAVIRYSGSWSEASYNIHKRKLETWLQSKGYQASGEAIWARYNPPFTLWFLRRNEVLIPIAMPPGLTKKV
ncbi:SOUL family heme-binding protein [Oceanisphaera sp. W20_SRM_FM3]|uniref:SOUL family heme-binding protein n=1 Tax=Oceanisphaera sp. W20_SRM_FM3 TaxID=3240267 RepID=UPI003F9BA27D